MKLEEIGFYTLSDARVKQVASTSPMWRGEILITDKCNFKCPYCQGIRKDCAGVLTLDEVKNIIDYWRMTGLKHIRFSGGEPTLHENLIDMVAYAKVKGVERIAISTNGSNDIEVYKQLTSVGVNDMSISLDACCSSFGEQMCGGITGMWEKVVDNIKELSKLTYVSLGMVFTKDTIRDAVETIEFGHSLGVSDIRIISASQEDQLIEGLGGLADTLKEHPILNYRINNYLNGRNVRGIRPTDANRCGLVVDDSAIAGNYHFPCIIYLREKGEPIGKVSANMRQERMEWSLTHDIQKDPICREQCLDVCIDYNNKYREYHD